MSSELNTTLPSANRPSILVLQNGAGSRPREIPISLLYLVMECYGSRHIKPWCHAVHKLRVASSGRSCHFMTYGFSDCFSFLSFFLSFFLPFFLSFLFSFFSFFLSSFLSFFFFFLSFFLSFFLYFFLSFFRCLDPLHHFNLAGAPSHCASHCAW